MNYRREYLRIRRSVGRPVVVLIVCVTSDAGLFSFHKPCSFFVSCTVLVCSKHEVALPAGTGEDCIEGELVPWDSIRRDRFTVCVTELKNSQKRIPSVYESPYTSACTIQRNSIRFLSYQTSISQGYSFLFPI